MFRKKDRKLFARNPRRRRKIPLLIPFFALLLVPAGISADSNAGKSTQPPLFSVSLKRDFPDPKTALEESVKIILENYYSPTITEDALYYAAIRGMLRFISPPQMPEHSKILTPKDYEKFEQTLEGKTVSIGIETTFNPSDGSLTVTEVIPGSPADGVLQPFDRILRIDGTDLKGKEQKDVTVLLEGEVDKKVMLTIVRDIKVFDITLTRKEFKTPNLKAYKLDDQVAVIEIQKITDGIAEELRQNLVKLKGENFDKMVVDLRNNPGGLLQEGIRMAEVFIPKGKAVLRVVNQAKDPQAITSKTDAPLKFELAVLINGNTASSCEVFTSALKDYGLAKVIGTHTYGKSILDRTFPLSNKFQIQFITGHMFGPLGKSWYQKGLNPDIEVQGGNADLSELGKLEPSERLAKDPMLQSAYNYLKSGKTTP